MVIQLYGWNLTWQKNIFLLQFMWFSHCRFSSFEYLMWMLWFLFKTGRIFCFVLRSCKQNCNDFRKLAIKSFITGIPHFTAPLRTFIFYRAENQFRECTSCLVCLLASAKDLSREKHTTLTHYGNLNGNFMVILW